MNTHDIEIEILLSGLENESHFQGERLAVSATTEVDDNGTVLPSCVVISYRFQSTRHSTESLQDHLNDLVPTLVDDLFLCLTLLLPRPLVAITWRVRCDGERATAAAPPRPEPAQLYILAGMWNRDTGHRGLSYGVKPELWPELEALFLAYRGQSNSFRRRLRLALHWLSKAACETSGPDRLVAGWISFNAVYADPTIQSEREAILAILRRDIDPSVAPGFVSSNAYYINEIVKFVLELRARGGTRRVDQELASQLSAVPQNANLIVETLALCIYSARNRLFHGNVDLTLQEEHLLSEAAEVPLCNFVRILLFKAITGHHLKHETFLHKASYGF